MNYLPKRMQTAHSIHYSCFLSFGIADTLTLEADFARENSSITCDYLNQLNQFRKRITRKIFSLITDWGLIKYCLEAEKETLFHVCFFNFTETEKCGRKEKWQRGSWNKKLKISGLKGTPTKENLLCASESHSKTNFIFQTFLMMFSNSWLSRI